MGKLDKMFGGNRAAINAGLRTEDHVPTVETDGYQDRRMEGTKIDRTAKVIRIDRITAHAQVRTHFDEKDLHDLAHSLKTIGQEQPCLVYYDEDDEIYVIICGERRWRAAKLAKLETLKCSIYPHKPTETELIELQYEENAKRTDLNPIEESLSFKRLQDLGYSANKMAERIGKNQTTISRSLKLLTLPEEIQQHIATGDLPSSYGREIAKLNSVAEQVTMAERYLKGEATTADAREDTKGKGARKRTSSTNSKKWKVDGVSINTSYPRTLTQADVARALIKKGEELLKDGRVSKAA